MLPESRHHYNIQHPDEVIVGPQSGSLRRSVSVRSVMVPQKMCAACHFSCLKCGGPNDYDCTACAPDALLTEKNAKEQYCASITTMTSDPDVRISKSMYIFLLVLGPALSILLFVIVISWIMKQKCFNRRKATKPDYVYDRVADEATNEQNSFPQEIIDDSSCSESE